MCCQQTKIKTDRIISYKYKNYCLGLLVERLIGIILGRGGGGTNVPFEGDDFLGSGYVWERELIVGIWDDGDIELVPVVWVRLVLAEAVITWDWAIEDGAGVNWEAVVNWEWLTVDGAEVNWGAVITWDWAIVDWAVVNWGVEVNWEWLTTWGTRTIWFISGGLEESVIGTSMTFCRGESVDCPDWI